MAGKTVRSGLDWADEGDRWERDCDFAKCDAGFLGLASARGTASCYALLPRTGRWIGAKARR